MSAYNDHTVFVDIDGVISPVPSVTVRRPIITDHTDGINYTLKVICSFSFDKAGTPIISDYRVDIKDRHKDRLAKDITISFAYHRVNGWSGKLVTDSDGDLFVVYDHVIDLLKFFSKNARDGKVVWSSSWGDCSNEFCDIFGLKHFPVLLDGKKTSKKKTLKRFLNTHDCITHGLLLEDNPYAHAIARYVPGELTVIKTDSYTGLTPGDCEKVVDFLG